MGPPIAGKRRKTMKKLLTAAIVLGVLAVLCFPAFAEEAKKADGKALYGAKCAMCHGMDGVAKPMAKGSRSFNDPAYADGVDTIAKVILEGKGKMPKMEGKLSADEAKAVAEYVKTLAPKK
jgi:mono/diheme cytochrome c family protein